MKKGLLKIQFILALLSFSSISFAQVVISQVYGGGGNSGAEYTHDFVELFNAGTEAVNINGWSIQYASAAGTSWSNHSVLPDSTILPGQYFLVQQAQGNGGTLALPTPDFIPESPIAMGGSNLKILLANDAVIVTGENPVDANIVDKIGFGTANGFEGTVAPGLSNTTSGHRALNGCQDTNDNGADFTAAAPNPRNSASPLNLCGEAPDDVVVTITTDGDVAAEITTEAGMLQLVATVTPEETSQEVVWSVAMGSEFASVDAGGLVTAIANGTATIRATSVADGAAFDEIDVVITNQPMVEPVEVSIDTEGSVAAEITTEAGTLQLVATVTPEETSQEVVWSVAMGSEFASVDASGLVTAMANGTATIRATSVADDTAFDEIDVIITNQPVIEPVVVSIDTEGSVAAEITTEAGTLQLVATVTPEETSQEVVWSVAMGSEFASVDASGLVTAIENGTATIRATSVADETAFDEIDVVITNQVVAVTSISITTEGGVPAIIDEEDGTLQLIATAMPSTASQEVVWSVEVGGSVVSINQSGLVTALSNGDATIRATSTQNPTVFDEIEITVDYIETGITELNATGIQLYPNPTQGLMFINATEKIKEIAVFNLLGESMMISNQQRMLDLSDLQAGVYFVKVQFQNGHTSTERIVKR